MTRDQLRLHRPRFILTCVAIGLAAGLLSGLFGVGGGTVVVPLLTLLLGFDQRQAAGTSLAAIVPTAAVGVISYATHDAVAWIPALILSAGAIIGAQMGTWLSSRLSLLALSWSFVGFLLLVVASLFFAVPSRDASLEVTFATAAGLVGLGLASGVLSGLLGVGGGIVVVPGAILLLGASDLVARGTSLLMMIPAALSGTVGNLRRHNVDLVAAVCVGVAACATTPVGVWIATLLDPLTGTILLAGFLVLVAVQMAIRMLRRARPGPTVS